MANEGASIADVPTSDTAAGRAPLLRVRSLGKSFGQVAAVRDVSFDVARGERVAMIGPNGAGKTTCFNLIHGELAPDRGTVTFEGASIVGTATHVLARRGIGRTFQIAATFPSMTVRESVALALAAHDGSDRRALPPLLAARSAGADALLACLAIDDLADVHCATLAYGDAKRLELALAVAGAPRLLMMDEPTAGMTPRSRHDLMRRVADLARERDVAVLFTEHDVDIVFAFATRVIVLDEGAIIASGPPEAVRRDPRVQAVYLGLDEPAPPDIG